MTSVMFGCLTVSLNENMEYTKGKLLSMKQCMLFTHFITVLRHVLIVCCLNEILAVVNHCLCAASFSFA